MTELKTLKELSNITLTMTEDRKGNTIKIGQSIAISSTGTDFYSVDDLRYEAIKWIKKLENDGIHSTVYNMPISDTYSIINFIKYFFNISEEELK